jgi:hypothetical protein
MAAAEEVTSGYDGWVYSDELQGYHDGYYRDIGEFLDYAFDQDEINVPEFVYCCYETMHRIDLGHVLENLCEEGWEDMSDSLNTGGLDKAIDEFHELNKDTLRSYQPDYKRKIRVPKTLDTHPPEVSNPQ